MKQYKKAIKYTNNSTVSACPVLPSMVYGDPATNEVIYQVYSPSGTYLGYTNAVMLKKFLYGGLYYKTGGKYSVDTQRGEKNGDRKRVVIFEKGTNSSFISLLIRGHRVTEGDLVDTDNKKEVAELTLSAIKAFEPNYYNIQQLPDPFKILGVDGNKLSAEVQEAIQVSLKNIMNRYIEKAQNLIQAQEILEAGTQESGLDLTF